MCVSNKKADHLDRHTKRQSGLQLMHVAGDITPILNALLLVMARWPRFLVLVGGIALLIIASLIVFRLIFISHEAPSFPDLDRVYNISTIERHQSRYGSITR